VRRKPRFSVAAIQHRVQVIEQLKRLAFLTTEEAAYIAGCHASFIREACRTGALPASRIGSRQYRVRPAALDQWLAASMPRSGLTRVS
jgi:excisionase family DNA binding protein